MDYKKSKAKNNTYWRNIERFTSKIRNETKMLTIYFYSNHPRSLSYFNKSRKNINFIRIGKKIAIICSQYNYLHRTK